MSTEQQLLAARVHGTLWAIIDGADLLAHPTSPGGHLHFPGAFEANWVQRLPVPIGDAQPPGASVALLDDDDGEFERPTGRTALEVAYRARPRTRVHEDIARDDPQAWYALAARHLGRMTHSDLAVTVSLFQSRKGDVTIGPHWDTWHAALIQLRGAKRWEIGHGLLSASDDGEVSGAVTLTTRPGDVLLIAKGLPHRATTPEDPGDSLHLSFAIHRDEGPVPARDQPAMSPAG